MIVDDYPEFNPSLLFKNKHLATMLPALYRKHQTNYTRKRITTPDNDFFDVDCILKNSKKAVVLLHGLEGSSQSQYIKGFANLFANLGYDVHAINFRSCSGEPNLLPNSYHSGFTSDLDFYLNYINPQYNAIYAIGFSLGGNVLLKYLGSSTTIASNLKASCAVSVPIDLKGSAMELNKGVNKIYQKRFLNSLRKKIQYKSQQFPQLIIDKYLQSITNFKQFDDAYTAPLHGFSSAEDYWEKCSSINVLHKINIPTLLVNAKNDPFLSPSCFPYFDAVDHPFLHAAFTNFGGHVGYMINAKQNWLEPVVYSFFDDE